MVVLTGTVADEATVDAVVVEAGRLFGAGNVVDELVVGEAGTGSLRLVGQVPDGLQSDVNDGLASLAETLGLELEDGFSYAVLEGDDAALQGELVELTEGIQINFASGSAVLPAAAREQLDVLVQVLVMAPVGTVVAVEGHTDSQGGAGPNQRLSENRAQSVVDYLIGQGVDEAKLRAVGNGESQPIDDNETAEGRAANRRIQFKVVL
ncbi:OmpA family protein [Acidimicrobiaceae bacterium AH-315-P05]|nr:OmpA family protein [Acidimicrobiaceae bacterium AH-315-P05]MBN4047524.1 OmpA family protein [Acidimicrobiaceae bacterium AH-315-P05]